MREIDCRQRQCPHPVVETRKVLLEQPDQPLTVLVGDDVARENVSRLAASKGFAVTVEPAAGGFALRLTPGPGPAEAAAAARATGPTVGFIASDQMGQGDEELGRILLKNLFFTMVEAETVPDVLLFVNAGVRLTCEGSDSLEALARLADRGVDIASCGLCLEFYGLKEKLAAGRPTNMVEILDTLSRAGRTIRP